MNSFFLSIGISYGYSVPGAALGTGDVATDETKKDSSALEIISSSWMEK